MEATSAPISLNDYAALEEPANAHHSELVRGRVVREPRPGTPHGIAQTKLARHLWNWVAEHGGGFVTSESGYILSEDPATVRGPDVAFVRAPRSPEGQPGGWIRGAPDVAVEVLSPADTSSDMQEKILEYLAGGAALVWIVAPEWRTVTVYRPDGSVTLLRDHQWLTGEDVLPGFALQLADLFVW